MSIALESIPRFSTEQAHAIAAREFGLEGALAPLPSERDQNFLLTTPAARFVLKIANRDDAPGLLEAQHRTMRRVAAALEDCRIQEVLAARSGAEIAVAESAAGARHCVRLMRWIEGQVLARSRPPSTRLLESIGGVIARLDRALADFEHPALHRRLQWDLKRAGLAREHATRLAPARRARVLRLLDDWSAIDWSGLPHGVIHGDANDHNVLVAGDRMVGLLDFGDTVHSATVCDLAIAIAYSVLGEADPLEAMLALVRGYHRERALTQAEQAALYPLVRARLAASVCYSAFNRARHPEDPYQVVSETAAWRLLDALEARDSGEVLTRVRRACAAACKMER